MITVIDYDAGNVGSVANALERLGVEFEITSDPAKINRAKGIIFPGQGRAGPAIKSLKKSGLDKVLPALSQPFLGICLGMQLMLETLAEDDQQGLGVIPGRCSRIENIRPVPHMGWNNLVIMKKSQLLEGVNTGSYVYFVHSYAVWAPDEFVVAKTDYGGEFASAINKDNFYGVQFHPEKSGTVGEQILKNFLYVCGENK